MCIEGLNSALVKDNYAIVLSVDRDYVDINFLYKEGTRIINYWIHPFLMENLDDEDRSVCREKYNVEDKLINYLLIYENVLSKKWQNILMGQMDWVEDYNKKCSMRSVRELEGTLYDKYKCIFDRK